MELERDKMAVSDEKAEIATEVLAIWSKIISVQLYNRTLLPPWDKWT